MPKHTSAVPGLLTALIAAAVTLSSCTSGGLDAHETRSASSAPTGSPPSADARPTSTAGGIGSADDERFIYTCRFTGAAPPISVHTLREVWAAPGYLQISSCVVDYASATPYTPTEEEQRAIAIADPSAASEGRSLAVVLTFAALCTRAPETGPTGLASQPRNELQAAAALCPSAPQGKIIAAWAEGERFNDGNHSIGTEIRPGTYAPTRPQGEECTWAVEDAAGTNVSSGDGTVASVGVSLTDGQKVTSNSCGVWWKIG